LLYLRTVRHLRRRQLLQGALSRVRPRGSLPQLTEPPRLTESHALLHAIVDAGVDPARDSIRRADQIVSGRYEFLNHAEDLPAIDWTKPYVNRLWTYNLHYFDYAIDLAWAFRLTGDRKYVNSFEALVAGWIRATEQGKGDPWDPYPISVRTVNWLYAILLFQDSLEPELREYVSASVFRQLRFLEHRIEWHLLGNHVFRNLKALVIGGLFFEGRDAERWRARAASQLWDQTRTQVSSDGGHFERSPMYHAIVLSDLLDVIQLMRARSQAVPPEIEERARRMARALTFLTRQDKSLRLLNDSALGIAPSAPYLARIAEREAGLFAGPVDQDWSLPETGYFGYRDAGHNSELIVSCREPSPSYQPGHSHCDILSYEWDTASEPVVVDSGLHGYDRDPYREYLRSTRAHNTLVINGKSQSEAWATFRFARRATEVQASSSLRDGRYTFRGSYRPYHDGHAVHRRTITLERGELSVTDRVEAQNQSSLESFLHFHPGFSVSVIGGRATAVKGSLRLSIEQFGVDAVAVVRGQVEPKQGWYC
jgi:uncharacterized heparinase superfamily protein